MSTPPEGRDRDERGRARNARPRDALGRPLPRGAVGVEALPDDFELPPDETVVVAQRLLDDGRPFQAHEVLEAAWKHAPIAERALWQGLAQLAVGITHAARGNTAGAVALVQRGRERIAGHANGAPYGLDIAGVLRWAGDALEGLGRGDATVAPLRLRAPDG